MSKLEELLAFEGSGVNVAKGKIPLPPVRNSREFERVKALPDFRLREDIRQVYINKVKSPGEMKLRLVQANALAHAVQAQGLFAPIAVGQGKTLIACLLPTVLNKRAVILTKPGLVRQAEELLAEYRQHFRIRDDLQWLAYSTLSSAKGASSLHDLQPELVIADECHALKDKSAARTKRFLRYFKQHPKTLFCGLSGTITKRSILDYAHLMHLALGDWTPLPRDWPTLNEWAEALDVGGERPPGVLIQFAKEGENAREGWRRKFVNCRGVVASEETELGCSLVIRNTNYESKELASVLTTVDSEWERPDGEYLTTALEVARTKRQVRLGGYYKWKWDDEVSTTHQKRWLQARNDYIALVRDELRHRSKPGYDSPGLIQDALERGDMRWVTYDEWKSINSSVLAPVPEWVWLSQETVNWVRRWVQATSLRDGPSIIWTDTVPFGRAVASAANLPYYGSGEKAAEAILREDGSRSITASIQAHGTGRNLQKFSRALVAGGTPTGLMWEQLLGRLHRPGQEADEVVFDVMFPEELEGAMADARYIEETTGVRQKLLIANFEKEK